ncbi:MAG: PAS domain-containing sensor histidine kinase [Myxococcales bacterium]|nr:PAS domain-containing sensor histidine kinase [Myxococcales bacterium]
MLELQNVELRAANNELRRIHEAMVVAHGRFQALYQLAPTPYVTIDVGRTMIDMNGAAEALLGASRDRLLGGQIDRFIDDRNRDRFRGFVDEVFSAGHERCGDVVLVRDGAAPLDALIDGVVLREAAEDPPQCVLALVDITARKAAERARREAQDEVLAIVSHDLRGPLNAIGLACDALAGELSSGDHARCVSTIARSSARCERLIKDLLAVAHIQSGRLTIEIARLDARRLVRRVCADHELAAAAAGSTLTVTVGDEAAPLDGDRDRLHQVLSNLIGNALVYARGTAIEVSVITRAHDVVIAVADGGPGIPPAELPNIFERYRQGAHHHGGAGLGLAIVKGLVEAHHGTVTATSVPGHGARFEIALPQAAP